MQSNKYFVSALSAFAIWGFFSLALKFLEDYPSLDILFYRILLATALLLLINLYVRGDVLKANRETFLLLEKKKKIRFLLLTISGGLLLVSNWYLYIVAVNHVSISSASFAYLICPIITTVLAFFILKERLNRWQWFSVLLCVISCIILSYGDLRGLLFSLIIAISFALYLISQRLNNIFDKFIILTIQVCVAALVLLPFYASFASIPTAGSFYAMIILIVVLFTVIPMYLNLYALGGMKSSTVGILMYINPLINFFLGIFYFKEEVKTEHLISYLLILISIVLFNKEVLFENHLNFLHLRRRLLLKRINDKSSLKSAETPKKI